ncbi:MAG: peptidoglycan-binding protein [Pseudomonadota bacterium]
MSGRLDVDLGVDGLTAAKLRAIVSVFESGTPTSRYDTVAARASDTGGLSYGAHQASLTSGNLHKLIETYVNSPGAEYADEFKPYLPALEARDRALDTNEELKSLLRMAARDPVMQEVQDVYFDTKFMKPAVNAVRAMGFEQPLSFAVAYDSWIQGSWGRIRNRVNDALQRDPQVAGEVLWMRTYVDLRESWLAGLNSLANRTTYRPQSLRRLMEDGRWSLELPFPVRDVTVTSQHIPAWSYPADMANTFEDVEPRDANATPVASDREIQELLRDAGYDIVVDGIYGPQTMAIVKEFQRDNGLPDTGVVDGPTYEALTSVGDAPAMDPAVLRAERASAAQGELEPMPEVRSSSSAPVSTTGAATGAAGAAAVGAEVLADDQNGPVSAILDNFNGYEMEILLALLLVVVVLFLFVRSRRI